MLLDEIRKYGHFSIYGAHVAAYGAYRAIRELTGRTPDCFIVSRAEGNLPSVDNIPVQALDAVPKSSAIVAGVTELLQEEIISILRNAGYENIVPMGNRAEYLLMRAYFDAIGEFPALDTSRNADPKDLALYEVRNHRDTPLKKHPELFPFEHAIQAGAAISDKRVAAVLDNTGDNISERNRQYCEMTASYWVWKHTDNAWKGIEHYRRHLLVDPRMLDDGVDAVLPLPFVCWPDTMVHLRWFVSENVLNAMLHALQTLHPVEYPVYWKILNGHWQYPCNMLAARKSVYDDYCAWFFHITEYMETLTEIAPEIATTRALSYVAEVLTNLYFLSHRDELRIRHVEKEIYT